MISRYINNLLCWAAILLLNSAIPASGQEAVGKRDSIYSPILKQERKIEVVMPEHYKPGDTVKYDVIYVLDGDWNTRAVADINHFLNLEGFTPPAIIVGILNIDRDKDLTPTRVAMAAPTSGGARNFLDFIVDELIPYVNKNYPTNGDNTLFGHSYGGLFVINAMLDKPGAFISYIAADPSLWWQGGYMNRRAMNEIPSLPGPTKTLFVSGRADALNQMQVNVIDTILEKHAPSNLVWKMSSYTGETHGTMRFKSIFDGLKFTYAGCNLKTINFVPTNGIVVAGQPFHLWFLDDTTGVRYTLDGSVPTLSSVSLPRGLTLPGPCVLKTKRFTNRARYDPAVVGEFKSGSFIPSSKKDKFSKPGGLNYAYYEGQWDSLPEFSKLMPTRTGIADSSFSLDRLPRRENFGLVMEGQLEIPEGGYYVFTLQSDDGSKFFFNHQLELDNDGLHDGNGIKSVLLPLNKGFYPIRIEYFQKDGGKQLRLLYITPLRNDVSYHQPLAIPLSLQYFK